MNQTSYLLLSVIGLTLVVFSMAIVINYSELLAGLIVGIGISISAFSTFKLLVNFEGKDVKKSRK